MDPRPSLSGRFTLVAGAGALALALAGCGGSTTTGTGEAAPAPTASDTSSPSSSGSAPSEAHGAADVSFAQGMIAHHRGAITMSEDAASRAQDPRVKQLAARITKAQGPEIDEMTSWLEAWGEPVPSSSGAGGGMNGMDGMDMGGDGAAGMMSDEEMGALRSTSGEAFDELWLRAMTVHHRGAVEMSRTEIDEGKNPQALALAKTIIEDQQGEIDEMQKLMDEQELPAS